MQGSKDTPQKKNFLHLWAERSLATGCDFLFACWAAAIWLILGKTPAQILHGNYSTPFFQLLQSYSSLRCKMVFL
ncbi:hypothetical protein LF95_00955 [Thalassospira sp. TSL5-1]|nr:hypothetical protein LF95_00955 [Thalassospira sp. TSL5-1]